MAYLQLFFKTIFNFNSEKQTELMPQAVTKTLSLGYRYRRQSVYFLGFFIWIC